MSMLPVLFQTSPVFQLQIPTVDNFIRGISLKRALSFQFMSDFYYHGGNIFLVDSLHQKSIALYDSSRNISRIFNNINSAAESCQTFVKEGVKYAVLIEAKKITLIFRDETENGILRRVFFKTNTNIVGAACDLLNNNLFFLNEMNEFFIARFYPENFVNKSYQINPIKIYSGPRHPVHQFLPYRNYPCSFLDMYLDSKGKNVVTLDKNNHIQVIKYSSTQQQQVERSRQASTSPKPLHQLPPKNPPSNPFKRKRKKNMEVVSFESEIYHYDLEIMYASTDYDFCILRGIKKVHNCHRNVESMMRFKVHQDSRHFEIDDGQLFLIVCLSTLQVVTTLTASTAEEIRQHRPGTKWKINFMPNKCDVLSLTVKDSGRICIIRKTSVEIYDIISATPLHQHNRSSILNYFTLKSPILKLVWRYVADEDILSAPMVDLKQGLIGIVTRKVRFRGSNPRYDFDYEPSDKDMAEYQSQEQGVYSPCNEPYYDDDGEDEGEGEDDGEEGEDTVYGSNQVDIAHLDGSDTSPASDLFQPIPQRRPGGYMSISSNEPHKRVSNTTYLGYTVSIFDVGKYFCDLAAKSVASNNECERELGDDGDVDGLEICDGDSEGGDDSASHSMSREGIYEGIRPVRIHVASREWYLDGEVRLRMEADRARNTLVIGLFSGSLFVVQLSDGSHLYTINHSIFQSHSSDSLFPSGHDLGPSYRSTVSCFFSSCRPAVFSLQSDIVAYLFNDEPAIYLAQISNPYNIQRRVSLAGLVHQYGNPTIEILSVDQGFLLVRDSYYNKILVFSCINYSESNKKANMDASTNTDTDPMAGVMATYSGVDEIYVFPDEGAVKPVRDELGHQLQAKERSESEGPMMHGMVLYAPYSDDWDQQSDYGEDDYNDFAVEDEDGYDEGDDDDVPSHSYYG